MTAFVIRDLHHAYEIANALGIDAANRQMRKAGRFAWSTEDLDLAMVTTARFYAAQARAFCRHDLAAAIEQDTGATA